MELEDAIASLWYIFLFAMFLFICVSQSQWLKTTIIGLDTLSEFQTDLVNDFIYSPCFIAKNKQGNNLHGVFDADLLDSRTTKKTFSEIIDLPKTTADFTINYAPTITNCVNTKNNYYFYEVREKIGSKTNWVFGNGSILGFTYDKTWTLNKKPISIKRGNTISSGTIIYGFSKNPPKFGIPLTSNLKTCEGLGGTICEIGETCDGGESYDLYKLNIKIPVATKLTKEDSKSLDDYDLYRPDGTGTSTYAKCSNDENSPNVFGFFKNELISISAFGPKLGEINLFGGRAFYMYYKDGTDTDNNNICFTNPTEYYILESNNALTSTGLKIPAGAYYCNEHNMVTTKTCKNGCSSTNPGYCASAAQNPAPKPSTSGGMTQICCTKGACNS